MPLLESYVAEPPPLVETEQGTIRMRGTRVPLDAVVYSYNSGATPEQIVQSYPPLNLRDVYAAITYYLDHRELVDDYLKRRQAEAAEIEHIIGSKQSSNSEFRSLLLKRSRGLLITTTMNHCKVRKILCLTLLIAGALFATSLHVNSQAAEQDYQPKVVRLQEDGGTFYQGVRLQNDNIQFFERGASLKSFGRFVEYGFRQDKAEQPNKVVHLSDFRLVLHAESPQMYQGSPGGQVMLSVSNTTVYEDLDGNSVLDTMTKNGPEGNNSYILYQDKWVKVGRYMTGFAVSRPVSSLDRKTKYTFIKGYWRIVP